MSEATDPTRAAGADPAPGPMAAPLLAGVVTAVVGFSSSFVVVLTGLVAVGATPEQAASGLVALCVAQAAGMTWLCLRHRTPITLAWSTPGAALLVSTGAVAGGWPAAVGAFVACGVLVLLTGLLPRLGALVTAVPVALARAMLAGVLLPLCLAPVTALVEAPVLVAPVVVTWLVLVRLARRWAVPGSLAVALAVLLLDAGDALGRGDLVPTLSPTAPAWTLPALLSVTLPLWVVTMASQNIPGVAVLRSFGYGAPWRESMTVTGLGTLLAAPLGGHAVNLAAITAALAAGPEAGEDRSRRWLAGLSGAATYLVLAALAPVVTALVAAGADGVVQAAAGLALLATLAAALGEALAEPEGREAVVATFVVAASGVAVLGVGAAFWALLVGLLVRAVLGAGRLSRS